MRESEAGPALRALGLETAEAAVVALLPLVQVAWADGSVDMRERAVLEAVADELGLPATVADEQPLAGWLAVAPPLGLYSRGRALLAALVHRDPTVGASLPPAVLERMAERCRRIAEASGQSVGLGSASAAELRTISEIVDGLSREVDAARAGLELPWRSATTQAATVAADTLDPSDLDEPRADVRAGTWQPPDPAEPAPTTPGDPVATAALTLLAEVAWAGSSPAATSRGWLQALAVEWGVLRGTARAWLDAAPSRPDLRAARILLEGRPLQPARAQRFLAHLKGMLALAGGGSLMARARAEELELLIQPMLDTDLRGGDTQV